MILVQLSRFSVILTPAVFGEVIFVECLLALFNPLSNGVDGALIRHFVGQLDSSAHETLLKIKHVKLSFCQNPFFGAILIVGAPIGATSYQLVIALFGIPHLIGGIIGIFYSRRQRKNASKEIIMRSFSHRQKVANDLRLVIERPPS